MRTLAVIVALVALVFGGLLVEEAVAVPTTLGYWKFDEFNTDGNHNTSTSDFQVIDSSGNTNHLFSWRGTGYDYTASTDLPSAAQFAGSNAYSVVPDTNSNAVLFHEVGHSGDDFDLSGKSFTLEGYFKTDGDKSGAGRMEMIFNSQSNFSYLVNLNEGGPGVIRFATGGSPYPQVNLGGGAGHNYADGDWHYFVARYDERGAGQQDALTLSTYDQSGSLIESGQALAPTGFNIAATTGNLSVGSVIHTTHFQGNLDEVRISRGLVEEAWQLNHIATTADTFDNRHDYKAAGTAGTVWDGLLFPGNASVISTANSPTAAGDGNLVITVPGNVAAGWDHLLNNAPFLYQDIAGDEDFDAQMVLESLTQANYSVAALMVRLADPLSDGVAGVNNLEDFLMLSYDNFGGWMSNRRRSVDDGAVSDLRLTPNGTQHRYMRVTRDDGGLFSLYSRAHDGDEWILQETFSRPDLAGDVQLGLWYGLFGGGNTGTAEFENFIVHTPRADVIPEPATLALLGLGLAALARRRRR